MMPIEFNSSITFTPLGMCGKTERNQQYLLNILLNFPICLSTKKAVKCPVRMQNYLEEY